MKLLREKLFTLRSHTPIPFLFLMVVFAQPTAMTMSIGFIIVNKNGIGVCATLFTLAIY
jgi:hypothetical protein